MEIDAIKKVLDSGLIIYSADGAFLQRSGSNYYFKSSGGSEEYVGSLESCVVKLATDIRENS
jgi:hypothetical protein